jgi:putative hydrolase of the HAD superfamily
MTNLKAIVFDVDGVLINCLDGNGNFLWQKNIERDLGISLQTTTQFFKEYWSKIGKGHLDTLEAIDLYLKSIGSGLEACDFMNYWHKKDSNINHDVFEFAKSIREKYQLFIGTNQEKYRVRHIHRLLNSDELFSEVFASCELGVEKPDVKFFKIIQERLEFKANEILFIDDSLKNVESARSVGWSAYHFEGFEKANRELFSIL